MKIRDKIIPTRNVNHLVHHYRFQFVVAELLSHALGQNEYRRPYSQDTRFDGLRDDAQVNIADMVISREKHADGSATAISQTLIR